MSAPAKPKRRWSQLRLRTWFIGVALVTIPLACVGHFLSLKMALVRLNTLGDRAYFPGDGGAVLFGKRGLAGISFVRSQITDEQLLNAIDLMKQFPNLDQLSLAHTGIGDAGIRHVGELDGLNDLDLSYSRVTDAGLVHLQGLDRLTVLNLEGTQVTDAGLVHLHGLVELKRLELRGTKVTDAGMKHVDGLVTLSYVGLHRTGVTQDGIDNLGEALKGCTFGY